MKGVAVSLAILLLPPTFTGQGASAATPQYKEHAVWMTLPSTGDSTINCNRSGPPIGQLQILEGRATSFNPLDTDTIGGTFEIYGLEGDSVGVLWDIRPGVMGSMRYRVRNPQGWSCWAEIVFAVPYEETDSIPPILPDTTGLVAAYYDNEDWTNLYDSPPDSVIQFYWGYNPPLVGMGAETFSVDWVGKLDVPVSGNYQLCVEACNGGWTFDLAGSRFSDWDGTGCNEICLPVGLTAGDRYDAEVKYHHSSGYAACSMRWINPSSQSQYIPPDSWRP